MKLGGGGGISAVFIFNQADQNENQLFLGSDF